MRGPYLVLLIANLVFATGYAVSRVVLADVGPATLGLARVLIGGALLLAWAAREGRSASRSPWTREDRVRVALMGVVGFALAFALGNWGLAYSTATNAALLITVEPTTLLVLSPLLLGERLSRLGVTGVTDATPVDRLEDLAPLAEAAASGHLPQRTVVTGGPSLAAAEMPSPLTRGPVKLVIADHALPSLEDLVGWVRAAHEQDRPVAVHCVTRTALALTLAALDAGGAIIGDRIEHGSVVPPELRRPVASLRLVVVTQPNFVAERGDRYLAEVDADDQPHLYPCRSLLDAGIGVGGGTDAPFGDPDPWLAIRAAIERRTAGGAPLGLREAVSPERALALFLTPPDDPGGEVRRVRPGAPVGRGLHLRS